MPLTLRESRILLVGDELLAGELADANGPFLAERLAREGLPASAMEILPDDRDRIVAAIQRHRAPGRLLVLCGGLGPTSDDRTTEAVAAAWGGRELVLHEPSWARIVARFAELGQSPPDGNEKQAMLPEGAEVLPNERGTAPGYVLVDTEVDEACVVLPGPPNENRTMVDRYLVDWLDRNVPDRRRRVEWRLRTFGLVESEVARRLRFVEADHPRVRFAYRFSFPEIVVKLSAATEAEAELRAAVAAARDHLGDAVYGEGDAPLPEVTGHLLAKVGLKVATAESCTAGLVAKLLTDTPGSSAWFERGFVVYANAAKTELLGVPAELLAEHGAVSEPVALAMLHGALERSRADLAVAITGIAGPTGGSPEKPVGTVVIAWGAAGEEPTVRTYHFPWDRRGNRTLSAWVAIDKLRRLALRRGGGDGA